MADDFTYNGVNISTPLVSIVNAEAIYDESGANVMFTKIRFRVQGTIQGVPAVGDTPGTFATVLNTARKGLLQPRASLTVSMADQTVVSLSQGDAQNGPTPIRCDFTEIVGAMFAIVVFEIDVAIQEKCDTPANIISHTYSVSHSIDSLYYTVRTLRGKVRVNRLSGGETNPDALRGLIVPPLPSGFKRDRMDFLVSADGLELQYEVVDRELYRVAPIQAVEASGRFSQQMNNFVWFNHFNIELKGHKGQTKLDMYNAAFAVLSSRFDFSKDIVRQATLEEELYDNVVRLSMVAQVTDVAGQAQGIFPQSTKIFTDVPGNTAGNTTQLSPYGSALLMAAKKAFFDPCGTDVVRFAQATTSGSSPGDAAGSSLSSAGPIGQNSGPGNLSDAQTDAPYTHWEQIIDFSQDNGLVMVPSAAATAPAKVFQMYSPLSIIVQQGQAIRAGKPVDVPPPQQVANGYLRKKDVRLGAPQLFPDKTTYCYSAAWRYEIIAPTNTGSYVQSGGGSSGPSLVDAPTQTMQMATNSATTFDPASASVGVDATITVTGPSQ